MVDFIGHSIGHYHITEQLGEGGMAVVYKAFDTHLERYVAVKVIRIDQFAPAVLEKILKRFEREAKMVGKLSHPNIVNVIDYGEFEGFPYLVMPYLDGGTLKSYLSQRGVLSWQEAVSLLTPIAEALQYAHEHNVLHRDVKPSNILLTDARQPMLTDFGVAKVLEGDEGNTLTGTGVGLGTPEYMAPEQWQGQFSAQSDIYSLGVVLYEMITGVRPYSADTPAAVLIKQITGPLRRPQEFVPDLDEKVEQVLFKALAIKQEDRYADMSSFVSALKSMTKGLISEPTKVISRPNSDIDATFDEGELKRTFVEPPVDMIEPSISSAMIPPALPQEIKPTKLFSGKFWINLSIILSGWLLFTLIALFTPSFSILAASGIVIGSSMGLGLMRQYGLKGYQVLLITFIFAIPVLFYFLYY